MSAPEGLVKEPKVSEQAYWKKYEEEKNMYDGLSPKLIAYFFARPLTCVYDKGFLGPLARKHCYHPGALSRAFAYGMQKCAQIPNYNSCYAKTGINHGRHGQTRTKLKAFRSKSPCLSGWSVVSLILLRKVSYK
jgi:hypothetical protein